MLRKTAWTDFLRCLQTKDLIERCLLQISPRKQAAFGGVLVDFEGVRTTPFAIDLRGFEYRQYLHGCEAPLLRILYD